MRVEATGPVRVVALVLSLLATTVLAACSGPGSTGGDGVHVPRDFIGLETAPLLDTTPPVRAAVMAEAAATHARLVRELIPWGRIQPYPRRYDFAPLDGLVAAAAQRHLRLFPVINGTPDWALRPSERGGLGGTGPPDQLDTLGRFAARLVGRYGPRGTFWRAHPRLPRVPVTAWQVWNEPNLPQYWAGRPDPAAYVRMLRVVGRSIHRADPGALVVSAGVPNSRLGMPFDRWVHRFFAAGGARTFDAFGLHAYARDATQVLTGVEHTRALMRTGGAGAKPIWITEVGWADRGPPSAFTTTSRRQAADVRTTLRQLAARRTALGLAGLVYFQLSDVAEKGRPGVGWGGYTGLLTYFGKRKPAWGAFTQTSGELVGA